jgi:hypothetical protein
MLGFAVECLRGVEMIRASLWPTPEHESAPPAACSVASRRVDFYDPPVLFFKARLGRCTFIASSEITLAPAS